VTDLARLLLDSLDGDALDALAVELAPRIRARLVAEAKPPEDAWMGSSDAARYLGMTRQALYKLTSARAIPFTQDTPGGRCWFRRSELDRWRGANRAV
jgi:excisionase family DNA binding protein